MIILYNIFIKMDLLLDIKINIASFDILAWITLYKIDTEFQQFTISKQGTNYFNNTFQHKIVCSNTTKSFNHHFVLMHKHFCFIDNMFSYYTKSSPHIHDFTFTGRCVFTNQIHKAYFKTKDIVYLYKNN